MNSEISEVKERGPVYWRIKYTGIRGGVIRLHIVKNRMSFNKDFILNNEEDFKAGIKICQDKVTRVLHFKNKNPILARLATYCIEATSVEESKEDFI